RRGRGRARTVAGRGARGRARPDAFRGSWSVRVSVTSKLPVGFQRLSEEEKVWAIRLSALGRSVDENRSDARASQAIFPPRAEGVSRATRRRWPCRTESRAYLRRRGAAARCQP